ncbi:hypothetical protein QVD17_31488 [Tagetes erecta]|uniref:SAM domain-containing protein n=1 Tax=Tagetes erecta TaxID=13708 RepID=A0AAD8K5P3_TARER|nr:hypothetical protein QVD17_31488 [Tagetes erecta]
MAEPSRVTITLGHTGQVVRRSGSVLDTEVSDTVPAARSKRSVRDRLGTSVDALQLDNKRLRGENGRWDLNTDSHLSKEDLRFKIMKKTQNNDPENTTDLRHMLSRRARPATTNSITYHKLHESRHVTQRVHESWDNSEHMYEVRDKSRHMPEPRNERQSMYWPRDDRPCWPESRGGRPCGIESRDDRRHGPESRNDRRHELESRDDWRHGPESRDDRRHGPESRDDRQIPFKPRDCRPCMPEPLEATRLTKLNDVRPCVPGSINGSMTGQYTSIRTSEDRPRKGFVGSSYSSWTLDNIRRKSPDRVSNTLRGLSPQRTHAYKGSRSVAAYARREAGEVSRSVAPTTSFLEKRSLSVGPQRSLEATRLVAPTPLPGGNMQGSQYPVKHLTVEGFLRSLGLEKFMISFKVEEIDMAALSQMGDQDLKDLGIPMGPRKKILLALLPHIKRRQAR